MNIVWLVASIVVWGIVHSWLASLPVKSFVARLIGAEWMRLYRLAYNGFALISFLPILWLMVALPDRPLYQAPAPWSYLMWSGQALAALLLFIGVKQTGLWAFIGISQSSEPGKAPALVTTGLYRLVRHPLYTAGLIFLWLTPGMSVNSFIVYAASSLYFVIGALFEERKLLREYGSVYAEYRKTTPMFLPRLGFHS